MKVLILGFDGLEHDLVEKFRLKALKQVQYGKLNIPKECYYKTIDPHGNQIYEPWTPFVWSSIVTGKLPQEIGLSLKNVQKWEHPLMQRLRRLSLKLGLTRRKLTRFMRGQGMKFEKVGFKKEHFNLMEDSKVPTIFHKAKQPMAINVPLVRMKRVARKDTWRLKLKGKGIPELVENIWGEFRRIKRQTLHAIQNEEWALLMSYMRFLDTVGELQFGNFIQMNRAYMACNAYVYEVAQLIKKDTIFLVISDHGMQALPHHETYGMHSDHAFYSLNMKTDWKPRMITDFYSKIIEWVKAKSV